MKVRLIKTALLGAFCVTQMGCGAIDNDTSVQTILKQTPRFTDVSEHIGLETERKWKYGGPSVSDINNDGYYDFLLTNHDTTPIQLYMANGDNTYTKQPDIFKKADLHGMSAGDYDLDGDNDILISLGGGNGLTPQPQRLLRNDNGTFVDATIEAGISEMGARGRTVRWVDIDNDGDLDFLQINAEKMVNEKAPRNILFSNDGDGTFTYVPSPFFEEIDSERVLITDFNNDNIPDLFAFNSYAKSVLLQGNGEFGFSDVTDKLFPTDSDNYHGTISVAQADIDNDGDLDYYLARGKLYYTIANNSVSFNKALGRLDLRDEGNKSHDGITFFADGDITLTDFSHFPRANLLDSMPVFLGKNKAPLETPKDAKVVTQAQAAGFPEEVTDTGWYVGYIGRGEWRMEWLLADNLTWDLRASVIGLNNYKADWVPQDLAVPDVLLRNDGGKLTDISSVLPKEVMTNNWGVTTGDFDNDGNNDFFVYRFGGLKERISDVLLLNQGDNTFSMSLEHGAVSELGQDSHGDMGTAFDYNLDGKIDILSGDDDNGKWHMYRNDIKITDFSNYLLIRIGYSESGLDPLGAKVFVETDSSIQYKLIGSTSASHSQSVLNIAHFGLGADTKANSIKVRWRDGTEKVLSDMIGNKLLVVGEVK
ncbi:CRTAC1 family protein [Paraglaciecola sp. L3A3]|uniref:CRTAC1 family protein n=1 Tax=Paraglaciecola sp. L3A3 TaxID=2686358 RepID=UPI001E3A08FE|nr:CRTAC1 family protein [Paraglaciecola sp. L3A3]